MTSPLTPEQIEVYAATLRERTAETARLRRRRREAAWAEARRAADVLRQQYGATGVWVFGSLVEGEHFSERSDIDMAATGLAPASHIEALGRLLRLSPEFEFDLVDLNRCPEGMRRAVRAWSSASTDSDDLYLDAVALNIHGFYAGLERVFVLVAERIDGSLPSGPNWHQDLLRQMTTEMPGVRAVVVSPDLYPALDRYRGFRHAVRNVCAYVLDRRLVAVLVEDLPDAVERQHEQLEAFADTLEAIADAADRARGPPACPSFRASMRGTTHRSRLPGAPSFT